MPEMDSSRHAEFGALLIVSNGCIQLNIRAKTCMRCVHTHKYTQCYTNAYVPTHRRRHRKKQLQNGVSDVFCPVVEMCLFLVRVGWDFLENLGFGGFSKENQSFPKFPKVSQSFPNVPASPFRSSLCFVSTPVGDCSEAPEGGFPKETQSSQKKTQASSLVLLARVRSHSPLS